MPIIPSAAYNNPDFGAITKNLGIALFGADALDPEARAKGRYYDAESARAAAEAGKATAEGKLASGRYAAQQELTPQQWAAMAPAPGETPEAHWARIAPLMSAVSRYGTGAKDIADASGTMSSNIYAVAPDDASKMTSLVVQGKPLPYQAAVSPGQAQTVAQRVFDNEKMKADSVERAADLGHRLTYQAAEDASTLQAGSAHEKNLREFPQPGTKVVAGETYIPAPGTPALDLSRAYTAPSKPSGGQPLTISPADAGMLDLAIARGYPGAVTEAHGKSPAIIDPKFWDNVGPQARQAAELAAQQDFQTSHSSAHAAAVGQAALGHAAGTPWSTPGWFGLDKGGFKDGGTPAIPVNAPLTVQGQQPQQQAAAPAVPYAPNAPMVQSPAQLPPLAQRTEGMTVNVAGKGAHHWSSTQGWLPGPGTPPQVAAPSAPPAALPPTAQVFAPSVPTIAAPAIPDSGIPQYDVQTPELAAAGFATPKDAYAAQHGTSAQQAQAKKYQDLLTQGSRGDQRGPMPLPDFSKLDPEGVRFIANDKSQPDEVRAAASNYLLRMPAQRTRH